MADRQNNRINLIFDRFKPDGGTERLALHTLASLAGEGLDLAVIARDWRGPRQTGVDFIRCKPLPFGRAWRLRRFAAAARDELSKRGGLAQAQVVMPGCDVYRADGGSHAEFLRQRSRVQSVWRKRFEDWKPYHRTKLAMEAEMLLHPRLQAVICNSAMVRDDILRHYPDCRAELVMIEPGIDLDYIQQPVAGEVRAPLGISADAPVFLFVGSGFERKGLPGAIRALAATGETESHLIAIGKDKLTRSLRRLAITLGVGDRVHLVGSQDDIRPYLQTADALLHPALYEPFGMVVVEAMASGLPVIASDTTGAAASMIRQGETGYVHDALALDRIAESMKQLMTRSNERCLTMREACLARSLHYSRDRMRDELLALYRRLLPDLA